MDAPQSQGKEPEERICLQPATINTACERTFAPSALYRPLKVDLHEIRLLKIHGQAQSTTLEVRCTSRHLSLLSEPRPCYETVSYCWGDASVRREILLDGHPFAVPASAEHALRRLRRPDGPRILWIDAICINQSDVEERGHQVSLMAEVYRRSIGNLVHLGEDESSVQAALDNIEQIVGEINSETDQCRTLRETVFTDQYRYSDTGLSVPVEFPPILALLERPWFRQVSMLVLSRWSSVEG